MNISVTEKLEKFLSKFKPFHYRKKEIILRSGDAPQGVNFIKKGYVKLTSVSEEGKELSLVIYKQGEFFPVVWTFFGKRASIYSFETLTPVDIKRVPRQLFLDFLTSNQDVFLEIVKHILVRFQVALQRMQFLTFGDASAKIASILLICAKDFGIETKKGIEIQLPLTHRDISNLVGLTRETVSIELKKFDVKGYLVYNSKLVIIKNKRALEKQAILS